MFYTCLHVTCAPGFSEILMAEIAEAGFDSFLETENGFEAYAENRNFNDQQLTFILEKYKHVHPLHFFQDTIEKKNWNEEWENNLQPVVVEEKCLIRAAFHPAGKNYQYEIIVTPKMSFGTGHHQTTYLMIKNQMTINHNDQRVMDAGCGTAILSIMASKLGAKEVEAFDIDDWSSINGKENIEANGCSNIHIRQGKIGDLNFSGKFDIILANINKNVLMDELGTFTSFLAQGGKILLSGFYVRDVEDLVVQGARHGLREERRDVRDTWAALLLRNG